MNPGLVAALAEALCGLLSPAAASGQTNKPTEVQVGALVNDIQQLDLQSHSYHVDLYMWFKWKNPKIDPSRSFEFMNAFELWGHILTYETEEPLKLPASDFGDPTSDDPVYSRVVVTVPVVRPRGPYATKLFLPMLLVALTAALALSVHPRYVEGRIGIGITALLTLVALQLTSNSSLPEVDYLLLLDKLYILSYAFVVLTLAVIVRNSWVDATGEVAKAAHADRRGLAVLTATYFAVAALVTVTSPA